MNTDRSWMWRHLDNNGYLLDEFVERVDHEFLNFAFLNPRFISQGQIKCSCTKCDNRKFLSRNDVHLHFLRNGFSRGYSVWYAHGESLNRRNDASGSSMAFDEEGSHYRTMVMDVVGFGLIQNPMCDEQPPHPEAQQFFDLLKDADEPLWDEGEKLPDNLYKTKKQLAKLGLGYEKIDACLNNCILYYKENKDKQQHLVCDHPRYKPRKPAARKNVPFKVLRYLPFIPRLQRLYASCYTCEHMIWHANSRCEERSMGHLAHGEAWKHFDRTHLLFASYARNVRPGLCTDGFSPFGNFSTPYSCWSVIIIVYNLPPWMYMQEPFMFLNMVIPGPKSLVKDIDVHLRPLIDELKILWKTGVHEGSASAREARRKRGK
ncbi:UNVERIFIED_CONTAM: hypothetical protein Sangu_2719300 [Sesamum angustifolium]|uniref:Transposase-associated domain-containing protein n=1 Tax=Sesamum angustifolium TaxID=2727405 RepID=A0AAW2IXZ1_9LAMI